MTQYIRYPYNAGNNPALVGNEVYVSTRGVDAPGRGGPLAPYRTYAYAKSKITDESGVNPYTIVFAPGVYSEPTFVLSPYISVCGSYQQNTFFVPDNQLVTLDPAFAAISTSTFIKDMNFGGSGGFFDATGYSSGFLELYLYNVTFSLTVSAVTTAATFNLYSYNCIFYIVSPDGVTYFDVGSVIQLLTVIPLFGSTYVNTIAAQVSAVTFITDGSYPGTVYITAGSQIVTMALTGPDTSMFCDYTTYIQPTSISGGATITLINDNLSGNAKSGCAAATDISLNATYSNGTSGRGATLTNAGAQVAFSADGALLVVGRRVLVWQQTNAFQNGIYTVTDAGSGATNWVLTRATDFDVSTTLSINCYTYVTGGTFNLGKTFGLATAPPYIIGTTNLTFSYPSGGISFVPLNGYEALTWYDLTSGTDLTGRIDPTNNIVTETGTSRTLVITDAQRFLRTTNAAAVTITVPPNSSVAFAVGTQIDLAQAGTGQLIVAGGVGVTINSKLGNLKISAQYAGATLKQVATDTWSLIGDLVP